MERGSLAHRPLPPVRVTVTPRRHVTHLSKMRRGQPRFGQVLPQVRTAARAARPGTCRRRDCTQKTQAAAPTQPCSQHRFHRFRHGGSAKPPLLALDRRRGPAARRSHLGTAGAPEGPRASGGRGGSGQHGRSSGGNDRAGPHIAPAGRARPGARHPRPCCVAGRGGASGRRRRHSHARRCAVSRAANAAAQPAFAQASASAQTDSPRHPGQRPVADTGGTSRPGPHPGAPSPRAGRANGRVRRRTLPVAPDLPSIGMQQAQPARHTPVRAHARAAGGTAARQRRSLIAWRVSHAGLAPSSHRHKCRPTQQDGRAAPEPTIHPTIARTAMDERAPAPRNPLKGGMG